MKRIAVLGAGITGVTTAYALALRGFDVTVLERHRYAAMDTSFANGGQLSASNAEVWNHSSTVLKGIRWMFTADAPLLINPMPSWHKLCWFMEFMANIPRYESNTVATARLAIEARKHLFSWAEAEQIDFDHKKEGILHIYRKKESFDHAVRVSKLLAEGGLARRQLSPSEIREIEPTLAGKYHGGFFTESDSTGDIHKFTHGLAAAAKKRGVKFIYGAEVVRADASEQGVKIAFTSDGKEEQLQADAMVVCAGVGSRNIAKTLGDRINVYPVKGYSITVNLTDELSQKSAPHVSLLDDETKLVTSRLGLDRFRVAGTAEFNGVNRNIRMDRIKPLVDWVNQCFPNVSTRSVIPWAGLRPMLPSMLPKVGKGIRQRVFYNTGHGHLGWTLSAATAELIAEAIDSAWTSEKIYR
ncbi:D-amino acid dehydrogenase [Pigmentiphaga litoralis]|uniref:D-amino acid dehydrogenase n=1 Tax=Pigmentiphaga litoralis TaxID=516702 RepID=UPI0038998D90